MRSISLQLLILPRGKRFRIQCAGAINSLFFDIYLKALDQCLYSGMRLLQYADDVVLQCSQKFAFRAATTRGSATESPGVHVTLWLRNVSVT